MRDNCNLQSVFDNWKMFVLKENQLLKLSNHSLAAGLSLTHLCTRDVTVTHAQHASQKNGGKVTRRQTQTQCGMFSARDSV